MARYSPMRGRRLTSYEAAVERFAASQAGSWLFVNAIRHVDVPMLARTNGRLSLSVGAPVGLLETTGGRSGRTRRTPVLYLVDGDDLVLVASNVGAAKAPAWLHNLRAQPRVRFLSRESGWQTYAAREAAGDEREQRWRALCDLYAGFDTYQRRTGGRRIAVVVLAANQRGSPDAGSSRTG
jgi:deazaflavin-dependent oxidoreductase (nitroreductase family)